MQPASKKKKGLGVNEGGQAKGQSRHLAAGNGDFQETQESSYWLSCVSHDLVRVFCTLNTVMIPAQVQSSLWRLTTAYLLELTITRNPLEKMDLKCKAGDTPT